MENKGKNPKAISGDLKDTIRSLVELDKKMDLLEKEGKAIPRWDIRFQLFSTDKKKMEQFVVEGRPKMEKIKAHLLVSSGFLHGWLVPKGFEGKGWRHCCAQNPFNEKYDIVEGRDYISLMEEELMRPFEKKGIAKRFWVAEFNFVVNSRKEAEAVLEAGELVLRSFPADSVRSKAEFTGWVLPKGFRVEIDSPWAQFYEINGHYCVSWDGWRDRGWERHRFLEKCCNGRGA